MPSHICSYNLVAQSADGRYGLYCYRHLGRPVYSDFLMLDTTIGSPVSWRARRGRRYVPRACPVGRWQWRA